MKTQLCYRQLTVRAGDQLEEVAVTSVSTVLHILQNSLEWPQLASKFSKFCGGACHMTSLERAPAIGSGNSGFQPFTEMTNPSPEYENWSGRQI